MGSIPVVLCPGEGLNICPGDVVIILLPPKLFAVPSLLSPPS